MTEPDTMILTVKLASGAFHAEIKVPVTATDKEVEQAIVSWFSLISQALKTNATNMNAAFPLEPKK